MTNGGRCHGMGIIVQGLCWPQYLLWKGLPPPCARGAQVIATLLLALAPAVFATDASPLTVGQPPPPLDLQDLDGAAVSLPELQGKVVIVDFWASWCAPCKLELPQLEALAAEKGDALAIIAVNVDERTKDRDRYLTRSPLSLRIADDSGQAVVARYGIAAMPTTVVLDQQGNVAAVHYGYSEEEFTALRAEVASLL